MDLDSFRSSRRGAIQKPKTFNALKTRVQSTTSSLRQTHDPTRDWLTYVPNTLPHRLRAVLIGHNPSDASWENRIPYAHRSNMFWRLLRESAIAPDDDLPTNFAALATRRGIAFGDLYVLPGSDAAKVRPKKSQSSRTMNKPVHVDLVERMAAAIASPPRALVLVSKTVAEQFLRQKTAFGKVGTASSFDLPSWLTADTEIWVLPSTSARAPMAWHDRLAPFNEFAATLNSWPWHDHPSPEE